MPKAGRYDFPEPDLEGCLKRIGKIHGVARKDLVTRETAAEILGMAVKSGWFHTLIGSSAQYELVDTGEGGIKITELAKSILYGENNEQTKKKAEAVRNIQLFKDIYDRYGESASDEQIRVFLRETAYVDLADVQSLSERIGKIFKKDVNNLKPADESNADPFERLGMHGVPPFDQLGGRDKGRRDTKLEDQNKLGGTEFPILRSPEYGVIVIKDKLSADFATNVIKTFTGKLKVPKADRKEPLEKEE